MKRTSVGLAAVAASAVALGAMASTSLGGQRQNEVKDLKLGILTPLSGDLASFGGIGQKASELAQGQLNEAAKAAGLTLNVTLAVQDTKTDKTAAQEAATKLIDSEKVSCIAGPWASSEVIAVSDNVSAEAGVPIVSPSSTNPDVTKLKDNGYTFRTAPSDALQGKVLAQVMGKAIGKNATVNTGSRNDSYGIALVREFSKAWKAGGGKIGVNVPWNPKATSLNSEAGRLVKGNPKAWMVVDFTDSWPKMSAALVRTGKWDAKRTFSTDGLKGDKLPKLAGKKGTDGMRGTAATADPGAATSTAFSALWTSKNNGERGTYDDFNFDATVICALAAVKANSTAPGDVAKQIQAVSGPPGTKYTFQQLKEALADVAAGKDIDYEGASGPIDMNGAGDPTAALYATWTYKGGKLVNLAKPVYRIK